MLIESQTCVNRLECNTVRKDRMDPGGMYSVFQTESMTHQVGVPSLQEVQSLWRLGPIWIQEVSHLLCYVSLRFGYL